MFCLLFLGEGGVELESYIDAYMHLRQANAKANLVDCDCHLYVRYVKCCVNKSNTGLVYASESFILTSNQFNRVQP